MLDIILPSVTTNNRTTSISTTTTNSIHHEQILGCLTTIPCNLCDRYVVEECNNCGRHGKDSEGRTGQYFRLHYEDADLAKNQSYR